MSIRSARAATRFKWVVFCGRCRRNLLAGVALFVLAAGYGTWTAHRFAGRHDEAHAFDRALVRLAPAPIIGDAEPQRLEARNERELYLVMLIANQRDVLTAVTVFAVRLIVALTVAGLGLVLMTSGATEWEIRSETAGAEAR